MSLVLPVTHDVIRRTFLSEKEVADCSSPRRAPGRWSAQQHAYQSSWLISGAGCLNAQERHNQTCLKSVEWVGWSCVVAVGSRG